MLFSIFWLLSMAFLANDKMRITNWPVNERSRGKLIRQSTSSLSEAELLEAACNRFKKARGLGNTKYAQLNACGIILAKYSPACF